jgi:hypothetical protein
MATEQSDWAVSVELTLPPGVDLIPFADDLVDELADRGASLGFGPGELSATITGFGYTLDDGLRDGLDAVRKAISDVAGVTFDIVGVNVRTYDQLEREGRSYDLPALAGVAEVAEELHVSKTRVGELLKTLPPFPRPLAQLAAGPVWDLAAVRSFAERWERKPGRPRLAGLVESIRHERMGPDLAELEVPARRQEQ